MSWQINRWFTNNIEELLTMSLEIDNNIFKAVTLTTSFMYVVLRLVKYLVCEIKVNNTKVSWKKQGKSML